MPDPATERPLQPLLCHVAAPQQSVLNHMPVVYNAIGLPAPTQVRRLIGPGPPRAAELSGNNATCAAAVQVSYVRPEEDRLLLGRGHNLLNWPPVINDR